MHSISVLSSSIHVPELNETSKTGISRSIYVGPFNGSEISSGTESRNRKTLPYSLNRGSVQISQKIYWSRHAHKKAGGWNRVKTSSSNKSAQYMCFSSLWIRDLGARVVYSESTQMIVRSQCFWLIY